jgi:type IV pilus assembly protein PilN
MISINLLPWRQRRKEQLIKAFNIWMGAAVFLAIFFGTLVYIYKLAKIADADAAILVLKNEINECDRKIIKINQYKKTKEALIARMKVVQTLQSTRILAIHLLDELINIMPEGVFLTSIQRVENRISLHGYAESNTDVSELMRNIEKNAWIYEPKLTEIKRKTPTEPIPGMQPDIGSEFQLNFIIKPKKTEKKSHESH